MEFVVIVLFVAAIVLVNFLVVRAQRRRAERPATPKTGANPVQGAKSAGRAPAGASPEASREAVARLDEAGHRQVYAAIAQGQPIRAIQVYAQLTGCGLRAASAAVASLASHPVPYIRQAPKPESSVETPSVEIPPADAGSSAAAPQAPGIDETGKRGDTAAPEAGPLQPGADTGGAGAGKTGAGKTGPEKADQDPGNAAAEATSPEKVEKDSPAPGTPKDAGKRQNPQTLPDEAEISKWAQNLRPEDF